MWLCGLQRTSRGSYKETNEQTRLHESGGIPNMLLCLRLQDTQQCGLANASSSRKLLLLTAPEPVRTEKARRFNKLKRLKKKKARCREKDGKELASPSEPIRTAGRELAREQGGKYLWGTRHSALPRATSQILPGWLGSHSCQKMDGLLSSLCLPDASQM